ncbi:MAG TPA: SDR family oxidoreductase [Bacteroidota bacterium]|nr:SDR family oxidoreductase [Bacteroidota bacterium]
MPAPLLSPLRPVVWIVGASRGIGAELGLQFAGIGGFVILSGRNVKQLKSVRMQIESRGGDAAVVPCDCRSVRSVGKAATAIRRAYGRVDVLINNAGITVFKNFTSTSVAEFDAIVATNLRGPVLCMQAVVPGMIRRKKGCIINILSNAAVRVFEGSAAYTASKAGLLGFTRVLREELRTRSVRVLAVLPGATETGMWSGNDRRRFGSRMMRAKSVAESVLAAYQMPPDVVPDEIILRPMEGDID